MSRRLANPTAVDTNPGCNEKTTKVKTKMNKETDDKKNITGVNGSQLTSDKPSEIIQSTNSDNLQDSVDTIAQIPVAIETRGDNKWTMADGEFIPNTISRNRYWRCFVARDKKSMKLQIMQAFDRPEIKHVEEEVQFELERYWDVCHDHVERLDGFFFSERNIFSMFTWADKGLLSEQLYFEGKLPELEAAQYVWQLASAIEYYHANDVPIEANAKKVLLEDRMNCRLKVFGRLRNMDRYFPPLFYNALEWRRGPEVDVLLSAISDKKYSPKNILFQ